MLIKIKVNYIVIAIVIVLTACDVHRVPETELSDEVFWKTEQNIKEATNALYKSLPGLNSDVNWSDDSFGQGSNEISDGSRLAPSDDRDYNDAYDLIRKANNIIEKSANADVDLDVLNRYIGESLFFRVMAHFSLVQKYGDIIIVDKVLNESSPELYAKRNPREEVFTFIYNDLDEAILYLPLPSETDYGRITKTTALAFKARIALFEGTRSKFHGYGDANKHLTIARDASQAVIDTGEHELEPEYFHLFQYEGERSKENILVKEYGIDDGENGRGSRELENIQTVNYFRGQIEQGGINPTKSLADAYLMTDGLPMDKSPLYATPLFIDDQYVDRDPRMHATFAKAGDLWMRVDEPFVRANLSFNTTGYAFRKYTNPEDWDTQRGKIDNKIIRYAEVLLINAEATFELNDAITDEQLDNTINMLRSRVGMPDLTNAFVGANGLNMQDEIRRERRVELAQENDFRYWDLIRWKTAEDILPQEILGSFYFVDEFGEETVPNLTGDNFILLTPASQRNFNPDRDYLWPIPTIEIALNPNLGQNPNW